MCIRDSPFIKRFELPIISMTGNTASSLAKYSDIVLDTGVSREACPLNLAPTSSTTAMLVMGDALAMALVEACLLYTSRTIFLMKQCR